MLESLKDFHDILYCQKSKNMMGLALYATIFVYGFMYRIIDLRHIFWCSIPFVLYFLYEKRSNPFDFSFLNLFAATLIISVIAFLREPFLNTYWSDVKVVWLFPMTYFMGCACNGNHKKDSDKIALGSITALNWGMFLQAVLDHIMKYFRPTEDSRTWFAFWKDDYEVSTVFDIGFLIMVSSFYYSIKEKKNIKIRIFTVIGVLFSIILSLSTEGRTTSCMFVGTFVLCLCFDIINRWNKGVGKLKKKYVKVGIAVLFLIVIAIILKVFNVFDVMNMPRIKSILGRDGGIVHNIRVELAIDGLKKAINIPQGGWEGNLDGGTHNTWLEFARRYNTIVFAFLMIYVVNSLKNGFKLIISKKEIVALDYFLFGALISMFLYMTLEPVGANPNYYYVLFFVFISGIVNRRCQLINNVNGDI